ncbi:alpha-D-ribose 1-methylphosphonate 5-triphosphate diphosphatase [Nocardia sp. NPDC059239]|uniref:alpha-D-ribose 1-methylphosphonate 5-triphosphate diphosphatase n=1 Tax=Nocardia sp. NPDC059239 TaxID=3346785 RepID=UPI00369D06FE
MNHPTINPSAPHPIAPHAAPIALHAARIYTATGNPADGAPGYITIADGTITAIGPQPEPRAEVIECGDVDLIPGLVDLHSDCWDTKARPRPSTTFPLDDALMVLDTEAVAWGITTHFTCIVIQGNVTKARSLEQALASVDSFRRLRPHLRSDHRIHLRVDPSTKYGDTVRRLAADGDVALMSYLGDTAGQGSFADRDGADDGERLSVRYERQASAQAVRDELANLAKVHAITLVSHDDYDREAVESSRDLGVGIIEFPVTREAAQAARDHRIPAVMGAPNLLRGSSHNGNLSAREALEADLLRIIASDYYPPALLRSLYKAAEDGLACFGDVLALGTANPARAANLTDRGTLEPGKRADIVAVEHRNGQPVVAQTWIGGRQAFGARQ